MAEFDPDWREFSRKLAKDIPSGSQWKKPIKKKIIKKTRYMENDSLIPIPSANVTAEITYLSKL